MGLVVVVVGRWKVVVIGVGEATINVVLAQVWGNMRMYDKSFVLQDVGFLLDHNSLLD